MEKKSEGLSTSGKDDTSFEDQINDFFPQYLQEKDINTDEVNSINNQSGIVRQTIYYNLFRQINSI